MQLFKSLNLKTKNLLKISSFQILIMFRRGMFYTFLSIYLRFVLDLSVTETTLFATLPMLVNIFFQNFVWGKVSDKFQKRRTLIILGEVLAAAGTVITWYIHHIEDTPRIAGYVIIIGFSVIEIFWSMSNLGWTAIISDLFEAEDRASVRGKLAGIGGIGRILGVTLGGFVYDGMGHYYEGWGFDQGVLFFIATGLMVLSTIPIFMLPEGGVSKDEIIENKIEDDEKAEKIKSKKVKLFTIFIISMAFINFGRNSIATIKSQYFSLESGLNVSSQTLSYIVNMRSLAFIVFGFLIGFLVHKYKEEKILMAGAIIGFIHLIGFAEIYNLPSMFINNFLAGVSHVVILAASYSVASKLIPPVKRGRLFAIYNATLFLSWGIAGTLIAGPIADYLHHKGWSQLNSYKASFYAGSILVLIGTAILIVFLIKYKKANKASEAV
ncbi:MAG: MFS transporter [Candidatus Mcinerneyibacterium aminivorans]|uniref:MFS transporter n=1 Tax=Candidatus Mcinerneyibacterium aminivorans TaxID=2703815 RepID=A0A5D0MIC0_9BACT|nr:MAG: MFS transporter [Candidatus Mcinerneyibacterium aminivorans]